MIIDSVLIKEKIEKIAHTSDEEIISYPKGIREFFLQRRLYCRSFLEGQRPGISDQLKERQKMCIDGITHCNERIKLYLLII